MKRWVPVVLMVVLPLSACGDDGTPARPAEIPSLSAASDLGTPLPSDWPSIALPEGSTVLDTSDEPGRISVDFETQELAAPVAAFFDQQLTAAGFTKGDSGTDDDTVSTTYTSGPQTALVTLVETVGTTTGTVRITTEAATPSAGTSPSADPSS